PVDSHQAAYDQLKTRLSGVMAKALAAEHRLTATLNQFAATEELLTTEVTQEEAVIADLEEKIAKLDLQIADTQARIEVEKQQLATMSRAIYRQPDSFWLLIARSGNLHEALLATADAVVAGQRAHALQTRLEADLAKLQADRQARQNDLDRESATLDLLNANLSSLEEVMSRQTDVNGQLADLLVQMQSAKNHLQNQPPDVTITLEPPFGPYRHFHTGVDIAAALGTPVMAAADGVVVAVGHTTVGYGVYVVIAHGGGIATLYGHLLQTNATVGDRVVRGQVIGLEGSTGL